MHLQSLLCNTEESHGGSNETSNNINHPQKLFVATKQLAILTIVWKILSENCPTGWVNHKTDNNNSFKPLN